MNEPFPCLMVRRSDAGQVRCTVEQLRTSALPEGEVLIEVQLSSLNYKDALACQGHPGVVRELPHVPGIDAAGRVAASESPDFQVGDEVLVTGYEMGMSHWGGFSRFVRVPDEWVVPMPAGLDCESAMTYGTAGFTAAQCVTALRQHNIFPERGEVVVTGASGGVGSIAVALLAKLGYQVAAVTGKAELHDRLKQLGATEIFSREQVNDTSDKPLLRSRWAGAVDTVGGNTLSTLLRSTVHRGCVAACGLAGGNELSLTVYPFILRGATLAGIDSAQCPRTSRLQMWKRLATDWRVDLASVTRRVHLSQVPAEAEAMLAGNHFGRTLVVPTA